VHGKTRDRGEKVKRGEKKLKKREKWRGKKVRPMATVGVRGGGGGG